MSDAPSAGTTATVPRIKGVEILNVVRVLAERREEVLPHLPESLHHYLTEPLLPHQWYPEEDHFALLRLLARMVAVPGKDVWEYLGRKNAEIDLGKGVYASMLVRGQPGPTLARLPRIWSLYRTAGVFRVELGKEGAHVELKDYPFLSDEFARTTCGYVKETLRRAGARQVSMVRQRGDDPHATAWKVSWKE